MLYFYVIYFSEFILFILLCVVKCLIILCVVVFWVEKVF